MADASATPETPEGGERRKVDGDVAEELQTPTTVSSSRSRNSPRSARSGTSRHREHRSGDRKEHRHGESRSRQHRSGGRDREHRSSPGRRRHGEKRSSHSNSRSGSRISSDTSRTTSDRDREAKRRARESRSEASPAVTPGVVSVANDSAGSRRVRDKVSSSSSRSSARQSAGSLPAPPLNKEERMRRRAEEEQDIKRRAKEGRSGGSGRTSGNKERDREAKQRAKQGRVAALTPGAEMASSRGGEDRVAQKNRMHDSGRPGATSASGADASKSKEKEKEKMSLPMAAPPGAGDGDEEVAVEAVAIDEEAEENERMRALEEQNRALAERMEQLMNNPVPNNEEGQVTNNNKDKEGNDDESTVEEEADKLKKKKRNICILVVLVLAIVGGVAAYFLTKSGDEPAATTLIAPAEDRTVTPAPIVPVVPDTQPPTIMDSASPSSSPTIDTYDPPMLEDCVRVKSGLPIEGQDDLEMSPFRMAFDVSLTDPDAPIGTWVPAFKEGIDNVLIPALAGCPITDRRLQKVVDRANNTSKLRKMPFAHADQISKRGLQEVDSPIRFVIANAKASINPDRDVTDNCEIQRSGCKNTQVVLELFLKGEEKGFAIITLVAQVLQYLADLEANGNRQLENTVEEERYHRKLLAQIFGCDPDIIAGVSYKGIENLDPTTSPSISPSRVPSIVPTVKPSGVPSVTPSLAPTTVAPTGKPTEGPTKFPTERPTSSPTPPPTGNPTPPPTPRPTPSPTPRPVESPTPQPVNQPTAQPFFSPTFTEYPYSEYPYSEYPYSEYPYSDQPSYPGNCQDDEGFRDSGEDPCSWYNENDSPGCPSFGSVSGDCTRTSCSAMDACCICSGDAPGCSDDATFRDSGGDDCQWYRDNDSALCPLYGTAYPGTCTTEPFSCVADDACCHCSAY